MSVLNAKTLTSWTSTPRDMLALIVLLDQFSRHVYRGKRDCKEQSRSDTLALFHAHEAVRKNFHVVYSVPEMIFALMPLRHTPTQDHLKLVLKICDARAASCTSSLELLQKFRKTSFVRLQHLEGKSGPKDGDILEFHEFEADESNVLGNSLVKCIHEYLLRKYASLISKNQTTKTMPTLVSLSGGVDSMVIAKILVILRDRVWNCPENELPSLGIHCVHIDYANRPESGEEASFVKRWCEKHHMTFHIRRIDEYTRGVTHRDTYEKKTREIRYETYKSVLLKISGQGVLFGHHRGDVQENVISNYFKGHGLLQLSGMTSTGIVNGVQIWRPLLSHDKKAILEFAKSYGVPYFKDTTPKWSTRGKMRNQLIPLLKDMFGPGVLNKLSALATESDATSDMVEQCMFTPLLCRGIRSSCCFRLDCKGYMDRPLVFWKEIFKRIFHSIGMSCPGNKAIALFHENLRLVRRRRRNAKRHELSTNVHDLVDEAPSLDKNILKKTYEAFVFCFLYLCISLSLSLFTSVSFHHHLCPSHLHPRFSDTGQH